MNHRALTRLLDRLWLLRDESDEARLFNALSSAPEPKVLCFVNTHAINLARRNSAFLESLSAASYLVRDGSGVSLLCRLFGIAPGLNGCGTDVIPRLLDHYKNRPVALCGTSPLHVADAAGYARARGCSVVLAADGFGALSSYVEAISAARPELVVLGMGMPKQELVARDLAQRLHFPVTIVCGGAILDYWAGRFLRAPAWVRRLRMEWVFRLLLEPHRLWRRYLVGNASFLAWAAYMRLSHPSSETNEEADEPQASRKLPD
jgi:N-acetylglucosaminyldiphosphoundecaprenol N-acetyl-beta-D-mannosaminyltransferase